MLLRLPLFILALGFLADKDLDALQGTWETQRVVGKGGKEVPPENAKAVSFVVQGDTLKRFVNGVDKNDPATLKVDATRKPAHVDLTPARPGDPKMLGIYELDGDMLKLCFSPTKRPEKFESPQGGDNTLLVLKRVKK
jgi:uncharacterized protein (TIGR03067 family)